MANDEHVALLKQGVDAWNAWTLRNGQVQESIRPNLSGANLSGANLSGANLTGVNLSEANLSEADLVRANLTGVNLSEANLSGADPIGANMREANLTKATLSEANLVAANLSGADLTKATLREANLRGANLSGANLSGANLRGAVLHETMFGATTLSEVKGLDECQHVGPCIVDFQTLKNSGPLPIAFLRGVGLPDELIEFLPSLLNEAIQFYSCFISYSTKDELFAKRLHADLQTKRVRCWFAPHDMPIGAKIIDALDEAIQLRDKLLLILSEGAIASDWGRR